jgi:integrase
MEENLIGHKHHWVYDSKNHLVCSCGKRKLYLKRENEDISIGVRSDGKKLSVRKHRHDYFMPDIWKKFVSLLKSKKARVTAEVLINTGCRINEGRFIEERDIDYERNTLKLRITKTKARKKGEEQGKPRTIPISSEFAKYLKKIFKDLPKGVSLDSGKVYLSTPAMNISMKKVLEKINDERHKPEMLSVHNIRKTHGNWLKIMGNLRMMDVDATEICLRLGHDYNTFLKDYGSSGVMDNKDILIIQEVLGDLYRARRF